MTHVKEETMYSTSRRGAGMTYAGSIVEAHGARVIRMVDCACEECRGLDPMDQLRRVTAWLTGGLRLDHARCASFVVAS